MAGAVGMMDSLMGRIKCVHEDCWGLCLKIIGRPLLVAGNIGVFCQNEEEYRKFARLSQELCESSDDPNRKYFRLKSPMVSGEATYTWMYIRRPDLTDYGKYLGDVDFVMESGEYQKFKGNLPVGAVVYDRPGWDMVQLSDPSIASVAYVAIKEMAERVRVKG